MTRVRLVIAAAMLVLAAVLVWVLFVALPKWTAPRPTPTTTSGPSSPAPAEATRRIRARLYYLNDDATRLQAVDAEVAFGESATDQARHLVEALLQSPQPPRLTPIPAGTMLRSLFVAQGGVAFVDLSSEVSRKHPGGVLEELLTVYSLVDTLTDNLPAITAVQVLVDGRETDTLAGHVDLRQPLVKDLRWTEAASDAAAEPAASTP